MRYRALVSFSGVETMSKGQVKELKNSWVINDLIRAGYIEPEEKPAPPKTPEVKKTPRRKGGKANV